MTQAKLMAFVQEKFGKNAEQLFSPMTDKIISGISEWYEVGDAINKLIERQNMLIELVKYLLLEK